MLLSQNAPVKVRFLISCLITIIWRCQALFPPLICGPYKVSGGAILMQAQPTKTKKQKGNARDNWLRPLTGLIISHNIQINV